MKFDVIFLIRHYRPLYSGAANSLHVLVSRMASRGKMKILIITSYRSDLERHEILDNGIEIKRLGISAFNKSGYLNSTGRVFYFLHQMFYFLTSGKDTSNLHVIGPGFNHYPSMRIAKWKKINLVLKPTRHGDDDPLSLSQRPLGFLMKEIYNNAHWISISKQIHSTVSHFGVCNSLNHLIPNPVEQSWKVRSVEKDAPFLFAGAICKQKGLHILLDIWEEHYVKSALRELHVAGPVWQRDIVESVSLINRIKNIKGVVYVGLLSPDELSNKMRTCTSLLFPSEREGLPNVVLEAMSMGLPVIANIIPGVTDYLLSDNRGLLVQNNNPNCWIDSLKTIEQSAVWETYSQKSRLWISLNATIDIVIEEIRSTYVI